MEAKRSVKNRLGWARPSKNGHYITKQGNRGNKTSKNYKPTSNQRDNIKRRMAHKGRSFRNHNTMNTWHKSNHWRNKRSKLQTSYGQKDKLTVEGGDQNLQRSWDHPNQKGVMMVTIPLYMCCKKFTAVIDCFTTRTKIGIDVEKMAISKGYTKRSEIIRIGQMERRVEMITIHMGTNVMRLKPIDCVIDSTTPLNGVVLGLQALSNLGYCLTVDAVTASHRVIKNVIPKQQTKETEDYPEEPFIEELFIETLTEAEQREIENM